MRTKKIIITTLFLSLLFSACELVEKYELPETGSITDASPPKSSFIFTQNIKEWEEYSFENKSKGALSYKWDFGQGTIIETIDTDPIIIKFPKVLDNYQVKLTASDQLGATHDTIIEVKVTPPQPQAVFEFSTLKRSKWNTVIFDSSSSISPDSYLWDFGDGTTSTEANPTHVYSSDGDIIVSLTVTTQFGASNTLKEIITLKKPKHFIPEIIEAGFDLGDGIKNASDTDTGDSRVFWKTGMRKTTSSSIISITSSFFEGRHALRLTSDSKRIAYQEIKNIEEDVKDINGNVVKEALIGNKFEKNVDYVLNFYYRFGSTGKVRAAIVKPTTDYQLIEDNTINKVIISENEGNWTKGQLEFNTGDYENLAIFFDNEGGEIRIDSVEFTLKE